MRRPLLLQPVPSCDECPIPSTYITANHTSALVKMSAQLGTSTNPVDQCDNTTWGVPTQSVADNAPDVHERSADSVHVGGGEEGGDSGGWRNGGQHIII